MADAPKSFSYPAMGTQWEVSIWDRISDGDLEDIRTFITELSDQFEKTYSRFIRSSLVWSLSTQVGEVSVPKDLVSMLRLYEKLYDASSGACTPLIGFTLRDMGYDEEYSLTPQETIHAVPELRETIRIIDDEHISLSEPVLLDLGALGKGFFVDRIADVLRERGLKHFLVNGSGDIVYEGPEPIRCGLEHPEDPTKVIGVLELSRGALCASSSNRRRWAKYHHTVDPHSLSSPEHILSTWVTADRAAQADGLATTLFLAEPGALQSAFSFEYCILNADYSAQCSKGLTAELF